MLKQGSFEDKVLRLGFLAKEQEKHALWMSLTAEPQARGLAALVSSTGIDYGLVSEKYAQLTAARGGTILTSAEVTGIYRRTEQ
jgi:L-2-hydroxyglutarate oxidase LhgO